MLPLNIFDTIAGLPLHPLIVHGAVVLLPLSALGLLGVIFLPRLRKAYAILAVAGTILGTGAVLASKESGEQLAARVGLPDSHADLAEVLTVMALLLSLAASVWWVLQRLSRDAAPGLVARITGWITAALVVPTLVLTVLVGHSGAQAAWGDRLAAPGSSTGTPSPSSSAGTPVASSSTPASTGAAQAGGFTLTDVRQHASPESCWAVVDAKVYDLTSWIDRHPGGRDRIIALCGTDASAAFRAQHDTDKDPMEQLAGLQIGILR